MGIDETNDNSTASGASDVEQPVSGIGEQSNAARSRRFSLRSTRSARIDSNTANGNTQNETETQAEKEGDFSVQEGIRLSVADNGIRTGKKRGRKPGTHNKKLSPAQALKAGESAANKICDFVSFGA